MRVSRVVIHHLNGGFVQGALAESSSNKLPADLDLCGMQAGSPKGRLIDNIGVQKRRKLTLVLSTVVKVWCGSQGCRGRKSGPHHDPIDIPGPDTCHVERGIDCAPGKCP